jgi:hypothetical protein
LGGLSAPLYVCVEVSAATRPTQQINQPRPNPTRPKTKAASEISSDLALSRLVAVAKLPGNASVGAAARTGLALLSAPAPAPAQPAQSAAPSAQSAADAALIARALVTATRIQGRTAYVADAPGSATAASDEDQALALAFLNRAIANKPGTAAASLVQKLSSGVARGSQPGLGALCSSVGGRSAGTAAASLASYDQTRGSTNPDAKITVAAAAATPTAPSVSMRAAPAPADKVLMTAAFTPQTAGRIATTSTPWSQLPANASRLAVTAAGRGEVSVAAGLTFTPATLLPFPTYRGLWVERVVQSESGEGSLAAVAAGQIVTVAIQITSPDTLGEVVVEAQMPGGLEPIDPAVYKDASAQLSCGLGGARWWWWCPDVQVRPSVVRIKYGYFGAGTYMVSFKATAATPGEFALPPVRAYAVGQPEVMGLSAAGSFTVCPAPAVPEGVKTPLVKDPGFGSADDEAEEDARLAAASGVVGQDVSFFGPVPAICGAGGAAPPVAAAKGCPLDCSGNGLCNLAAGACVCNAGFSGGDCSKLAAT